VHPTPSLHTNLAHNAEDAQRRRARARATPGLRVPSNAVRSTVRHAHRRRHRRRSIGAAAPPKPVLERGPTTCLPTLAPLATGGLGGSPMWLKVTSVSQHLSARRPDAVWFQAHVKHVFWHLGEAPLHFTPVSVHRREASSIRGGRLPVYKTPPVRPPPWGEGPPPKLSDSPSRGLGVIPGGPTRPPATSAALVTSSRHQLSSPPLVATSRRHLSSPALVTSSRDQLS
jgi:hypothetical protein